MASFNSSQEVDSRVKFYDKYYKVAEEYDKVFMKKHEEDLNTTLIFVSYSLEPMGFRSMRQLPGWFVLCCDIGFHRRLQPPVATRSERRDRRSPSRSHPHDWQRDFWRTHPNCPSLDWSLAYDHSSPEHPLLEPCRVAIFGAPRHARQAVVKPVHIRRRARVRHREKPTPSS